MPLAHAVLWLEHHHADVLQFDKQLVTPTKIKDHAHDTRQHHSGVRTQHEFFGAVSDALAGITYVLVAAAGTAQRDFRGYVEKHRTAFLPQLAGWETVDHPSEGELVALARTFFTGHDRMIGLHTMA